MGRTVRVQIPVGERGFSLLHHVQTGSEAYSATFSMDTRLLCRRIAAGA